MEDKCLQRRKSFDIEVGTGDMDEYPSDDEMQDYVIKRALTETFQILAKLLLTRIYESPSRRDIRASATRNTRRIV